MLLCLFELVIPSTIPFKDILGIPIYDGSLYYILHIKNLYFLVERESFNIQVDQKGCVLEKCCVQFDSETRILFPACSL